MSAIAGQTSSPEIAQALSDWSAEKSYLSVIEETLKRYGFHNEIN